MRSIFDSPRRSKNKRNGQQESATQRQQRQDSLFAEVDENEKFLRTIYADCPDVIFRPFMIAGTTRAVLIHIEGLTNVDSMERYILLPLMQEASGQPGNEPKQILERKTPVPTAKEVNAFGSVVAEVASGNCVVLVDGQTNALSYSLAKWEKRAIEEPTAEAVVRGPREGFVESISVNMSLLRRKIQSPKLKLQRMQIGRYTQTSVGIVYLEGIAKPTLIDEISARLKRIDIDGILESAYIEELIEDSSFSLFPQIMNTERPDVAAANLLEGRVVILVDGTPVVLIAPTTFYSLLQSAEDYYHRFLFSTFIRWLRFTALVISLILPSMYVAVLTFHQEMVPTALFYSIAKSREEIPFPVLVEALIMEVTFEALREAGIRLPKQVGAAVSIVGALVIGQAAVSAGIVSAPMVMVVAITGISSFMIPRYSAAIALRILRFPIMMCAGVLGLLGIMLAVIATIVHMCTLRSFGVPYLSPLGPIVGSDIKDVLVRAPWWGMNDRPHGEAASLNLRRENPGIKPSSEKE